MYILGCAKCGYRTRGEKVPCPSCQIALDRLGDVEMLGRTLSGYTIQDALGTGGMAEVYRVRALTGDDYALKVLPPQIASDRVARKRFEREGRILLAVRHENVVRVEQFGDADGIPFLVMELITGRSLTDKLRAEKQLSPLRSARIALQINAGIGALHEAGIIHRDLKPSNIMLVERSAEETAKIVDLGLARMTAASRETTGLTRLGTFVGTPSFTAPEQLQGEKVDATADLFSLGAIIYAMLTGAPPWKLAGMDLVAARLRGDKPSPLPPIYGLEKLVEWLMEPDPRARPENTEVVRKTLEEVIAAMQAHPSQLQDSSQDPSRAILDPPSNTDWPEALPLDPAVFETTVEAAVHRSQDLLAGLVSESEPPAGSPLLGPWMAKLLGSAKKD